MRVLGWVIGLLSICFILNNDVELARHKLFWGDEALETYETCGMSLPDLIAGDVKGQCSKAPLYYVLEKISIRNIQSFDSGVLVRYRLVSLLAAAGTLIFLFAALVRFFGFGFAYLGLALLNAQPIFHVYAAENRPYMLWLLLFTVLLFSRAKAVFAVSAVSIGSVATAGGVQSVAAVFARFLMKSESKSRRYLILVGAASLAVGAFYMRGACHYASAGEDDLLNTKNWDLLESVVSLLFPFRSTTALFMDAFLLLGTYVGIRKFYRDWVGRGSFEPGHMLAWFAVTQLGASVVLGALVAIKHYYFTPRVFIYLIVCRVALAVTGLAFVVSRLQARSSNPSVLRFYRALVLTAGLAYLSVTLHKLPRVVAERFSTDLDSLTRISKCLVPPARQYVLLSPYGEPLDRATNNIVRMGAVLKACEGSDVAGASDRLYLLLEKDGTVRASTAIPPGSQILYQAGIPVTARIENKKI